MSRLFAPESVAVVGASSTPGKLGNSVVRNLVRGAYEGRMWAVNRDGGPIEGIDGATSILKVPGGADVAMIVVPAAAVPGAIRDCAASGVKYAIIGASGFAELGTPEGAARQHEIMEIARTSGLRVIGPNTNGIYSASSKLSLGYNAAHAEPGKVGPISFISHSGALFDGVARRVRALGAGLNRFIPVGNEADLNMLDFLEFLITDPETSVIGLIMEGVTDGKRLRTLASEARNAGKRIFVLKLGRSEAGAEAALAHSSRMAGAARSYDALFKACGIGSVSTVEALAGACVLATLGRSNADADEPVLCISSSGAGGALLVDTAGDRGIAVVSGPDHGFPAGAGRDLRAIPSAAAIRHPVDLGSVGDWSLLNDVLAHLEARGVGGPMVAFAHGAASEAMSNALHQALKARRARVDAPLLILAPGGLGTALEVRYAADGIPVFYDTACAFESLQANLGPRALSDGGGTPLDSDRQRQVSSRLDRAGSPIISEVESALILSRMGIPVVESIPAAAAVDAVLAAQRIGYPVVLKAIVPHVAHKNAAGLVRVGVADEQALLRAHAELTKAISRHGDGVVVVQKMHKARIEVILGLIREPDIGHFLLFGLGGLLAEQINESVLVALPADPAAVEAEISASRLGAILRSAVGERGDARISEIVDSLMSLQALAAEQGNRIVSAEINPMLVAEDACIAVDALIITDNYDARGERISA